MGLLEWAKEHPDSFFELPDFKIFTDPQDANIRLHLKDSGVWEPKVTEVVSREFAGGMFVDAGAHWGYYSLLAAKKASEVHAFEANPMTFRYLQLNVLLNGFHNVYAYPLALWESTTMLGYSELGSNTGGSRVSFTLGHRDIQTARLDDLFQPNQVDFIKVDCEGTDAEVLRGAEKMLREGRPKLLVESPPREFLENLGYSMTLDCGSGFGPMSLWVKRQST